MGGAQSYPRSGRFSHHHNPRWVYARRPEWQLEHEHLPRSSDNTEEELFDGYAPSSYDIQEEFTYVYASCTYKTPSISSRFFQNLPTVTLEHDAATLLPERCASSSINTTNQSSDKEECLICFAAYSQGNTLVSLPACGHSYHKNCLNEWMCRQCTCPYCRYEYPTDHPGYEVGRKERMRSYPKPLVEFENEDKRYEMELSDEEDMIEQRDDSIPTKRLDDDCVSSRPRRHRRRHNNSKPPVLLVDILHERQERLRYMQHRRTVLDQLSFTCPIPPPMAIGVA